MNRLICMIPIPKLKKAWKAATFWNLQSQKPTATIFVPAEKQSELEQLNNSVSLFWTHRFRITRDANMPSLCEKFQEPSCSKDEIIEA